MAKILTPICYPCRRRFEWITAVECSPISKPELVLCFYDFVCRACGQVVSVPVDVTVTSTVDDEISPLEHLMVDVITTEDAENVIDDASLIAAARELMYHEMAAVCHRHYGMRWCRRFEVILWQKIHAVEGGEVAVLQHMSPTEVLKIRTLSEAVNGWFADPRECNPASYLLMVLSV